MAVKSISDAMNIYVLTYGRETNNINDLDIKIPELKYFDAPYITFTANPAGNINYFYAMVVDKGANYRILYFFSDDKFKPPYSKKTLCVGLTAKGKEICRKLGTNPHKYWHISTAEATYL